MTDSDRIDAILRYLNINANKLASQLGFKNGQTFYDIRKGKHSISKELAGKIQAKYSILNKSWLLTGEGDMLCDDKQTNNDETLSTDVGKCLDIIKEKDRMMYDLLKEKDTQMNRILEMLENKIKL